jgi:hypothetical protein
MVAWLIAQIKEGADIGFAVAKTAVSIQKLFE